MSYTRGLFNNVAMESVDEHILSDKASVDQEVIETEQTDIDEVVLENQATINDIKGMQTEVKAAEEVIEALESLNEFIGQAKMNGGLTQRETRMAEMMVTSLSKGLVGERMVPTWSMESFDTVGSAMHATSVAQEGIKEVIQTVKAKASSIRDKAVAGIRSLASGFAKLFGGYGKAAKQALAKLEKMSDEEFGKQAVSAKNFPFLVVDGKVAPTQAVRNVENMVKSLLVDGGWAKALVEFKKEVGKLDLGENESPEEYLNKTDALLTTLEKTSNEFAPNDVKVSDNLSYTFTTGFKANTGSATVAKEVVGEEGLDTEVNLTRAEAIELMKSVVEVSDTLLGVNYEDAMKTTLDKLGLNEEYVIPTTDGERTGVAINTAFKRAAFIICAAGVVRLAVNKVVGEEITAKDAVISQLKNTATHPLTWLTAIIHGSAAGLTLPDSKISNSYEIMTSGLFGAITEGQFYPVLEACEKATSKVFGNAVKLVETLAK